MLQIRKLLIAGALLGAGGLLFAFSGFYSVAATSKHLEPVRLFFEMAMSRSVSFHSRGIAVPRLDDPAMIRKGAGHYEGGCAPCHGSPASPQNPIALQMMPEPPHLANAGEWPPAELFWIVKHGVKYAGMPAWVAQTRDDEVWSVVAFLQQVKGMSPQRYRRLAFGPLADAPAVADQASYLSGGGAPGSLTACARCHGLRGGAKSDGAFPRLEIQQETYLAVALRAYRSGRRPSGIMQPVAARLSDKEIDELARYYAGLSAEAPAKGGRDVDERAQLAEGATIAHMGTAAGVPACVTCHAPEARAADRPALAGQHKTYLAQQLALFRAGKRGGPEGVVMSAVALQLTDREIAAVSAYYASLQAEQARTASRASSTGTPP